MIWMRLRMGETSRRERGLKWYMQHFLLRMPVGDQASQGSHPGPYDKKRRLALRWSGRVGKRHHTS